MMKILKYLFIIVLFLEALVIFSPKQNIYFYLLSKLHHEKIVIKHEKSKDKFFTFNISNINVFYENVDAVSIKKIDITTYLFVSKIDITNLKVDEIMKQFLPGKIKLLQIYHSILNPLKIDININLQEAKAYGVYDIQENKITLKLKPSKRFFKLYKKLLKDAKKLENGEYQIEYKL